MDEALIAEGLGLAWTRDGQHGNILIQLERVAKDRRTGCLWLAPQQTRRS